MKSENNVVWKNKREKMD